jgi:hypothetical protein
MIREGAHPLTPLTTAQLQRLMQDLGENIDAGGAAWFCSEDVQRARHAIAELIDIRNQLQRIAAACTDKTTAHALMELVGVDA